MLTLFTMWPHLVYLDSWVDVHIIPTDKCKEAYEDVNDSQVCAGEPEGGKDTCQGDSGGPLASYCAESNRWIVKGVTSYGEGCAKKGKLIVLRPISLIPAHVCSI